MRASILLCGCFAEDINGTGSFLCFIAGYVCLVIADCDEVRGDRDLASEEIIHEARFLL